MNLSVKKSCGLALFSILILVAFGKANAQSQIGQGVGAAPQFLPVSGWQVQKTPMAAVRGLENLNLPCMMAVNYDNGYSLRFSGSGQKILAMAIDFRQNVFTQGRKYGAGVNVDNKYQGILTGTSFSKSVLIFNMREAKGFNSAISNANKMTLNVEDNPMVFSLNGISNALSELDSCSGGTGEVSGIKNASIPPVMPSNHAGQPMTRDKAWEDKVEPLPARTSKEMKQSQMAKGDIWEAKAGDDMKAVLEKWASQAGVDIDWQSTQNATVSDDVRVQGSFEDAVQTLLARNAAAEGLDAIMKSESGITSVSTAPQKLISGRMGSVSHPTVMGKPSSLQGAKWSAPIGSSLEQVLRTWSKKAGVEFYWQSNQGFSVKSPVASGGSYESALQSLLDQYTDEKIRPNAQLNNDPMTGRRMLFVQSSRVL